MTQWNDAYGLLICIYICSGWWFGTFFIFPYIGNFITPTDELIFFRGVAPPATSIYIYTNIYIYICIYVYIYYILYICLHTYITSPQCEASSSVDILDKSNPNVAGSPPGRLGHWGPFESLKPFGNLSSEGNIYGKPLWR
jgi:hypothetical protein